MLLTAIHRRYAIRGWILKNEASVESDSAEALRFDVADR
jgi:hypothetical protein